MILAVTLAGLLSATVVAVLVWTARKLRISSLDAQALAVKIAVPKPASALDWPELLVRAVVPQPDEPWLVLLDVSWPGHPGRGATLLVALDRSDQTALRLLFRWCDGQASIAPTRGLGRELELRRRQSLERVRGSLVAEDVTLASLYTGARRSPQPRSGARCLLDQEARFQVTEKPLPLLFSAPGCAFTLSELSTIVISSSVNEEMTPEVEPSVTLALLAVHELKSVSG